MKTLFSLGVRNIFGFNQTTAFKVHIVFRWQNCICSSQKLIWKKYYVQRHQLSLDMKRRGDGRRSECIIYRSQWSRAMHHPLSDRTGVRDV